MQNKKQIFKKYYTKLALEGILKSFVLALIIGFAVNFVISAISWAIGFDNGLWVAIGCGAGVIVLATALLYALKFSPTTKEIAQRVDRLGLEERVITMVELENDQSYIAMRQREDTKRCLEEVNAKRMKLILSKSMLIVAAVAIIVGGSMTTVVGLAKEDIIPDGSEIIAGEDPRVNTVTVSYIIDEGGEIVGEADQILEVGQDATPVTAVAIDGWTFVGWSDGVKEPGRTDLAVTADIEVTAMFEEIPEGDGSDSESDGSGPNESEESDGDQASDEPGDQAGSTNESGESSDEGEEGGESDGNGNTEDEKEGESDSAGKGEGNGAGGRWEDNNQIIDGETYYEDELNYYYELAMQIIANGGEISDELRAFIEKYYDSI